MISTNTFLGNSITEIEFTINQWDLLEKLEERLESIDEGSCLSCKIATEGRSKISAFKPIAKGQSLAKRKAEAEPITFIWGPPGTGKTETLASIAIDLVNSGQRVLMLSYSNVSVDGALLRTAKKNNDSSKIIVRYGYPKDESILNGKKLYSYNIALCRNPELEREYYELLEVKKQTKKKDDRRIRINKRIEEIRKGLKAQEGKVIQEAAFVATTIAKAVVDPAIYLQKFDTVIFDEASMAYVPHVIYAASLAKKHFVCLGDFKQLPAVVMDRQNTRLSQDIFTYAGITEAVECKKGHDWLVMLYVQYRMHPDIADFVSEEMYDGELETAEGMIDSVEKITQETPLTGEALGMIDLEGMYSVCIKTHDGSRINILSALLSVRLAVITSKRYATGIISPYSAQSKLLHAMVRDLSEEEAVSIKCATVHQFQGGESPVIFYDPTDSFHMKYCGQLLTKVEGGVADRLFNVAITRAKGKFMMVLNTRFFKKKRMSKRLLFSKMIEQNAQQNRVLKGNNLLEALCVSDDHDSRIICNDKDKTWERYMEDIQKAKKSVLIDIPGFIDDTGDRINGFISTLDNISARNVEIKIRIPQDALYPEGIMNYAESAYVLAPVTIIDNSIIWYGHPLFTADFFSEGDTIPTICFPTVKFVGKNTARQLKVILEM